MVEKQLIPIQQTGYFSRLICNYLEQKEDVKQFYHNFSDLNGFEQQIKERQKHEEQLNRKVLVSELAQQYKDLVLTKATAQNISALKQSTTFTVTTGHQLNLFTGPLYFLYKIISTINTCKILKQSFPKYDFVPIYWMATEDHDFDEIRYFNYKNNKITWRRDAQGAVGDLNGKELNKVFDEFSDLLGPSSRANDLRTLFNEAYLKHNSLSAATRFLANKLFGSEGLVILDGHSAGLKREFIEYMKTDLLQHSCFEKVNETNAALQSKYNIQVNPREINLFYLDDQLRERIVFDQGRYQVLNSEISFDREQILIELQQYPEKFSPNVLMRPLYQEVLLPNLGYIGGGGEIAYWLQLKSFFNEVKVPFPVLMLRNSALIVTKKERRKANKLDLSNEDLFKDQNVLIKEKIRSVSEINLSLEDEKLMLRQMFNQLIELSDKTDKSFTGAVKAQHRKQIKGLEHLEKRLLKAQKRKLSELVNRIETLQNQLFPKGNLQERVKNFSEFYEEFGEDLITILLNELDPFDQRFTVLTI